MAVRFLVDDVSDLCLGKPALRCLPVSATVGDAISVLRMSVDCCVSVWSCHHSSKNDQNDFDGCTCVGKVCMVDIVCFLCREDNLLDPATALQSSVEAVIPKSPCLVQHLDPEASLLEAIELILEGAQNLVVPIQSKSTAYSRKKLLLKQSSTCSTLHNNLEYCWLTQEDILRYLLNSIAIFNPIPVQPIKTLDIINTSVLSIHYDDPAASILPLIAESLATQTAIAVVDSEGRLIGEISPGSLSSCDLTVVAALKTLSAGDLMAYIDCGGPTDDLAQIVKSRLQEMNLDSVLEFICDDELGSIGNVSSPSSSSSSSFSSSSDEEFGLARIRRSGSYHSRIGGRGSEAIVCYPWNSLIAVMIQALTHRVNYVWVVEQDATLTGIVTFASMMKLFHERLKSMS